MWTVRTQVVRIIPGGTTKARRDGGCGCECDLGDKGSSCRRCSSRDRRRCPHAGRICGAAARSINVHGRVVVPWLGVTGNDSGTNTGAMLATVTAGSPASAAGLQSGDTIISMDGQPIDPSPERADDPCAFESESGPGKAVDQSFFRQQPHRPHHVPEVETRGVYLDFNLTRPNRRGCPKLPTQRLDPPGMAARQAQQIRRLRPARRKAPTEARNMAAMRGPDDFRLGRGGRQLGSDLLRALIGGGSG